MVPAGAAGENFSKFDTFSYIFRPIFFLSGVAIAVIATPCRRALLALTLSMPFHISLSFKNSRFPISRFLLCCGFQEGISTEQNHLEDDSSENSDYFTAFMFIYIGT